MNLEQRVQALEQELEILKHQIQATLLDIREQLLNATYPELRSEEAYGSEKIAQDTNPSKPIRQIVVNPEIVRASSEDSAPTVQVRRVSLQDVDEQPPSRPTPPPAPTRVQQHLLDDLEADYSAPLAPINRNRAAEYDRSDDTLHYPPVRRVTVDNTPLPFTQSEEDAPPIVAQTELLGKADWDTLELLEDWVTRKIKQFGPKHTRELIKAYADQGHFDMRMKAILLQLASIISSEDGTPPAPVPQEEEELPQKTILRLIAGLQNAGITSNGRRKPNG
jgi:hypothetical protein